MPSSTRPARGAPGPTLAAVCFGLFMVGLDGTVVSVANPAISASLGTSFAELQWITNAYLLGLAVFLILGGTLGDRFGRRRMYLTGVVAFAVTSVAIGFVGPWFPEYKTTHFPSAPPRLCTARNEFWSCGTSG